MNIPNRLLRVVYSKDTDCLYTSDVRGCVHKFDRDLNLLQSSPVVSYDHPVNAICVSEKHVITKDRFGSIGKWDIHTLEPLDFYDGRLVCDQTKLMQDEEPSPTPNRGIATFKGNIYTNNGYNQMVVIDEESFELVDVRDSPAEIFIDCICTENPDLHILSDVLGRIYIGDITTNEFPIMKKVDSSVIHGVVYDKRHDRFWTTQDGGLGKDRFVHTGVTTIEKDGSNFQEYKISHEDNEFIEFDPECKNLFVGGFNGKVFIFDNTEKEFNLKKIIGPLRFQIIHGAVVSADEFYVLLQTGDLIKLNADGKELAKATYRNRCVWILEPHPEDESIVYAGTDYGVSRISYGPGRFGSIKIKELSRHSHGIVKDVRPLPDGSYVCITRGGYVVKAREDGTIEWHKQVLGVPRGVALSDDYSLCMISTDEGEIIEFNATTGEIIDTIKVGGPSYGCAYLSDGRRVATCEDGQQILVFPKDSHEILGRITGFDFRLKRLIKRKDQKVFVTGPDGMFELDFEKYERAKYFGEYLVSTKENGVLVNGHLYMGGYGYQIGTYRYEDSQIIDLQEKLPDFTKAFAARIPEEDNIPILLVGGRGGFINAYKLYSGIPFKVREFYIR